MQTAPTRAHRETWHHFLLLADSWRRSLIWMTSSRRCTSSPLFQSCITCWWSWTRFTLCSASSATTTLISWISHDFRVNHQRSYIIVMHSLVDYNNLIIITNIIIVMLSLVIVLGVNGPLIVGLIISLLNLLLRTIRHGQY